ncbi:Deltamethrin resistance protein prag01 [Cinara cedri]|uniref:Deltamethrin resistance protein prag01 n=1 Tax=Cinara cedri TaxID=506608 RepID=A0A5E4N1J2_9HEMI|nr:Deltamethrin resistance protein prag01 [Cinara cedri]
MLPLRKLISFKQLRFQRSQTLQISFLGKKKKPKDEVELSVQERFRLVTMDDMPVPKGDWIEHNAKRNQKYNAVLAVGFISLIGSIIILKDSMFFNAFPPPYPFNPIVEDDKCDCQCEC